MTTHDLSSLFLNELTGTGLLLLLIGSATMLVWKSKKKLRTLWIALISTGIISILIKFLVQRPRPLAPTYFFGTIHDYSFPSLHAALAFATLPFLWNYKKYNYLFFVLVMIIIVNRIYFQEHYWTDVLGGAIIGLGVSIIIKGMKK